MIYDILLNFQPEFYDFFEWNEGDTIIHIKKIPLFLVDNKTFYEFQNFDVKFDYSFLVSISNKCEFISRAKAKCLNYAFLVSNGKDVFGILYDKNLKYSTLLFDEKEYVCNIAQSSEITKIPYTLRAKKELNYFLTRYEKNISNVLYNKIVYLFNHREDDKLKYLYLECFNKNIDDVNIAFKQLVKEVTSYGNCFNKINYFFQINQK